MTITFESDTWLFTIIPILSIIAVVYVIIGFAWWKIAGRDYCKWTPHD